MPLTPYSRTYHTVLSSTSNRERTVQRIARDVVVFGSLLLAACGPFNFVPEELEDLAFSSRDVVTYLARQRHDQVAFGNAVLGTASLPSGTRAHGSLRVTATGMGAPELSATPVAVGPQVARTLAVETGTSVGVSAAGAARVFRGFGRGPSRYGAVDVVGTLSWLPDLPASELNIESGSIAGGAGVRIGITDDHDNVPAVSLLLMGMKLPSVRFGADQLPVAGGGTAAVQTDGMEMYSSVTRLAVSKQLGAFGVTAGFGADEIRVEGDLAARIDGRNLPTNEASLGVTDDLRRTTLFAGGSYRRGSITFAGEIGHRSGGSGDEEFNAFASGGGSRVYLNLGVRLGP